MITFLGGEENDLDYHRRTTDVKLRLEDHESRENGWEETGSWEVEVDNNKKSVRLDGPKGHSVQE